MSRLSKLQAKRHQEAEALLRKDVLTDEDRWEVYEAWQESAHHVNNLAGAFFTPMGLACDFSVEVPAGRVIDLCAGIGALSFAVRNHHHWLSGGVGITCVELNPAYVAVGRKLLPEATWVEASVFDLPDLGWFDCAIANPPFGASPRAAGCAPRYAGKNFEYHVIDIASDIADYGVFIVPQASAPFAYSGRPCFEKTPSAHYGAFAKTTGIELEPNCGIDTAAYARDWHGVAPTVEIVTTDFAMARHSRRPAQGDLLGAAA